jgi:hypothetical protein
MMPVAEEQKGKRVASFRLIWVFEVEWDLSAGAR